MTALWEGPALSLPGGSTLLSRRASALVLAHLDAYRRTVAARDGGSGRLSEELAAVLEALRMSATGGLADMDPRSRGHADMAQQPSSAVWDSDEDLLPLKEAAEMLGLTDRHARRLASGGRLGPVEQSGRARLVRRSVVETYETTRPREEA